MSQGANPAAFPFGRDQLGADSGVALQDVDKPLGDIGAVRDVDVPVILAFQGVKGNGQQEDRLAEVQIERDAAGVHSLLID